MPYGGFLCNPILLQNLYNGMLKSAQLCFSVTNRFKPFVDFGNET
jgi:hypothetical protein